MSMNKSEIDKMLNEIFPPKPEPPSCQLSERMLAIVAAAQKMGLEYLPAISIEAMGDKCSCVDFSTYNVVTIRISTQNMFTHELRSSSQLEKTLAHELGHCFHLQAGEHYGTKGLKWCEDYADEMRDKLLTCI